MCVREGGRERGLEYIHLSPYHRISLLSFVIFHANSYSTREAWGI